MASNILPITEVISVSATVSGSALNEYNTSNVGLFTDDVPLAATQTLTFSGVAASGNFTLSFNNVATSSIAYNATLATIQADIMAVTGMSNIEVSGSIASQSLVLTWPGVLGAIPLAVVSANTLQTSGSASITITPTQTSSGWSGGSGGYASYLDTSSIASDFGTSSKTYLMSEALFSQAPNILANNGQLIIMPFAICQQTLTLSGVPASGAFEITYGALTTGSIAWNATASAIQTALQALAGLSQVVVTGSLANESITVWMYGVYGKNPTALGTTSNTLETSAPASITITQSYTATGESISTAITRMQNTVQFFAVTANRNLATIGQTDLLAAGANIQSLNKIGVFVSNNSTDIEPGGMIDLLRTGDYTQTRGLYYGDSSEANDVEMCAAYIGRAFSTNFNGSNTVQSMHLKQLSTIQPDPTMTQTILGYAQASGADVYVSIQGYSCVYSSGANLFFDQVYNLQWFTGAIQVAGFNYLAGTSSKIPQTEPGMTGLKGAYRQVAVQAVTNGYVAPGTWNSSTTFGNQTAFLDNVSNYGFYIYSTPVAQQSEASRTARQAPLVQIALKEAGSINSSDIQVIVNA